ncbi:MULTISPECIES: MarR family transcriptional regulator [Ferroplasma]|jgi:DNA-binding MarR family transcriptional regulator|uniref:ArsR family transcriptional regulator n=1 Tax=Ferroplasma acidiphilum TaxID=74969 RepID=A0A1V0N6D3_9ARCH|nr:MULTISPECIES: MarR family transcriptional regulator [Ferroplasma]ARD85693.1 ArsR family transcriptional regulator [Ferroplasma acidiphilum]MCL4349491.1 MarR family transcriptional regulator [Candidatus Thermoplasmatota archaeon]NOL60294.1 MarR family transcriptional regulator [Ferroplasma acidiphilum]WMT52832.1 MAG: MarR family transcriptional regulator [Ferroplasma acidiphilum]
MEQELKMLTPSTRLVFMMLRQMKVARLCQIIESTGLSRRSVLYSVKKLNSLGLIEISICLSDTRQRFYCIKINE